MLCVALSVFPSVSLILKRVLVYVTGPARTGHVGTNYCNATGFTVS